MKKIPAFFASTILVLVPIAQFTSCEKYVLPELDVSEDTLLFSKKAQFQTINIVTNVSWALEAPVLETWLNCSPIFGEGDSIVTVTVQENTGEMRTADVSIFSETIKRKLVIIQDSI